MIQFNYQFSYRWARRIAIAIVGGTVMLIGVAMLVLPGPGVVVILIGLGILGAEFAWARVWLQRAKATGNNVMDRVRHRVGHRGKHHDANSSDSDDSHKLQ